MGEKGLRAPMRVRCAGFVNTDTLSATKLRTKTVRIISLEGLPKTVGGSKNGVKPTKFIEMAIHVVKQNKMKIHFVVYLKSQEIFLMSFDCTIYCNKNLSLALLR